MTSLLRVLRYLAPYRWQAMATVLCAALATAMELAPPWFIKIVIDDVIQAHQTAWLPWVLVGLVVAYALKNFFASLRIWFNIYSVSGMTIDFRPYLGGLAGCLLAMAACTAGSTEQAPPAAGSPVVAATNDPVIAAAGDIACDTNDENYNNGLGTDVACRQLATSNLLMNMGANLKAVLLLGDTQYEEGVLANFMVAYDRSWGRLKGITFPAVGNHEYLTAGAAGYYGYFGRAAGDPKKGYYSYAVGAWHVIALNSNCEELGGGSSSGGCGPASPQVTWLKQDLAEHPALCTLAYWHHPRFTNGINHDDDTAMGPIWEALYAGNADVVLNGHLHSYERFAPMNPAGAVDLANGIREFVVGTGGKDLTRFKSPLVHTTSEARIEYTFGVLKLTVKETGYDWQFLPIPGSTQTDSGTGTCH